MVAKVRDTATADIRVVPVGDVPWGDVRTVFGTRGDPATCWCQFFKLSNAQWRETDVPTLESALCEQVRLDPGPGLIAYVGDEPVGWVAVEPRPAYRRLRTSRIVSQGRAEQQHDDPSVWSITCFVVRVGFRRRGVASALLAAAIEHARASGARVVEGVSGRHRRAQGVVGRTVPRRAFRIRHGRVRDRLKTAARSGRRQPAALTRNPLRP